MASHIERRKFLATLGGAAVAWPLAARGGTGGPGPRCVVVTGTEATAILQPVTMEKLL